MTYILITITGLVAAGVGFLATLGITCAWGSRILDEAGVEEV